MTKDISPDFLRKILRYEPDTGKLFWLPTDARNRLAFAGNAMLEDGMTPAQIRDHMRRYADVIDGKICGTEGEA